METRVADSVVENFLSNFMDEDFFRMVMDNNPDRVFVKRRDGIIIYANQAFLEMYAPEKRDRIIGTTTIEDFSEDQVRLFQEEDRRAFDLGKTTIVEELADYTGRNFTFLSTKTCFRGRNGESLMLGVCDDITALARRERELVEANSALQNFAALAAHDLRSPLGTYASLIDLIKLDKQTTLGEKSLEYLNLMNQSVRQLASHISGLLSTYKASHEQKINGTFVDLNILLEEVKFNLSDLIKSTGTKIFSNRLPTLQVDENLFRQLLHNLIENSIKYRSSEKPRITFKHDYRDGAECFTIEDNGIGISPDESEKVFQIYHQGHKNKAGGIGLGLSLCRKIAELHHGEMWIDHEYKNGCRLCFTIKT
jgi:PAS domain S-box-containing protein